MEKEYKEYYANDINDWQVDSDNDYVEYSKIDEKICGFDADNTHSISAVKFDDGHSYINFIFWGKEYRIPRNIVEHLLENSKHLA